MSTATSDYPDWFNPTQFQNPEPFAREAGVFHDSTPVTWGPFFTAQWPHLYVNVLSTDAVLGAVQFAMDSGFLDVIAEYDFATIANVQYRDVVPVIGPWVRMIVTYHTGAGTVQTWTTLLPTRNDDPYMRGGGQLYVYRAGGLSIGAGITATITPLVVTSGRAIIALNTNAGIWNASLFPTDSAGTSIGQLAVLTNSAAAFIDNVAVTLPADPTRLTIFNGDGAARNFSFAVVLER